MYLGSIVLCAVLCGCVHGERWRWPEDGAGAASAADSVAESSVRIDNKVQFTDADNQQRNNKRQSSVQADEYPFREPTNTEGFYNRPPGAGRYPVRVRHGYDHPVRINGQTVYLDNNSDSDGTLDSIQHCKCVTRPDCDVQTDHGHACGTNQYLCCYNQPKQQGSYPSEYFNEVEGERPMLFPNRVNAAEPFPPPTNEINGFRPSLGTPTRQPEVLVGPGGPTGEIGPQKNQVLVGPGGPTGVIGPQGHTNGEGVFNNNRNHKNILVGPNGPTGELGPSASAQRGVLVGPGGPTGIIGPAAQRGVLVGPGGPTGIIGPRRQGVLVGPGGPTGIVGPAGFNRQRPGVLVGPGGPTGTIGPGRQILVGPGGPTGQIGPRNYFF